jgi:hypothetical protein
MKKLSQEIIDKFDLEFILNIDDVVLRKELMKKRFPTYGEDKLTRLSAK